MIGYNPVSLAVQILKICSCYCAHLAEIWTCPCKQPQLSPNCKSAGDWQLVAAAVNTAVDCSYLQRRLLWIAATRRIYFRKLQ